MQWNVSVVSGVDSLYWLCLILRRSCLERDIISYPYTFKLSAQEAAAVSDKKKEYIQKDLYAGNVLWFLSLPFSQFSHQLSTCLQSRCKCLTSFFLPFSLPLAYSAQSCDSMTNLCLKVKETKGWVAFSPMIALILITFKFRITVLPVLQPYHCRLPCPSSLCPHLVTSSSGLNAFFHNSLLCW